MRALALESMSVSRVAAALGELLAHRQQHNPDKRSGHVVRRSSPLRRRGGSRGRGFPRALRSRAGGTPYVWRRTRRGDKHVRVRRAQEQPQCPRPEHRWRACAVDRLAQAHNLTLGDSRATICYRGLLLGWIGLSAKDLSRASCHPAWRHTFLNAQTPLRISLMVCMLLTCG